MLGRRNERGDTIVEVLFAVAIFSLVAVGAFSLVNQGIATAQRSLESTLVRQEMDAQAETLRFMHSAYTSAYQGGVRFEASDRSPAAEWSRLVGYINEAGIDAASPFGTCPEPDRYLESIPEGSFFVDPMTSTFITDRNNILMPETWAQIDVDGDRRVSEGIRIEAVPSPESTGIGYIDFHIRACWDAPGLSMPMTLGTIVRLYDPR